MTYICCHRAVWYGIAVKYKGEKYDWRNTVVITYLSDKVRRNGSKYICITYHSYVTGSQPKEKLYSPSKFASCLTSVKLKKSLLKYSICAYMTKKIAQNLQ